MRAIIAFSLLILLCLPSPAEEAIPTPANERITSAVEIPRTTIPPDFYQVIIDNNLFRPLGWRKPTPAPRFALIATVMRQNGLHKALIRNTRNRTLQYAAVGEELIPGVTITEITRHAQRERGIERLSAAPVIPWANRKRFNCPAAFQAFPLIQALSLLESVSTLTGRSTPILQSLPNLPLTRFNFQPHSRTVFAFTLL